MSKGYRLYNLKTHKVIASRDVIFDEKSRWNWEQNQVEDQSVQVTIPQQSTVQDDTEVENSQPSSSASSSSLS